VRLCEDSPFTTIAGLGIYNSLQIKLNSLLLFMLQNDVHHRSETPQKYVLVCQNFLEYLPQGGLENKY